MVGEITEEATSRVADLGWTQLHYNDVGSGDPLLLLHGGGPGASSWSNFGENIGPLAEHFRVLAVDAPGFGKSAPLVLKEDENRVTTAARAIRDLLDSLKLPQANLVGNSMGGATALTFAVDYPDRVAKIVMMGASPIGQGAVFTPVVPSPGIRTLQRAYAEPTVENFRVMFDAMVFDSASVPDGVLEQRAASVDETHRTNFRASLGAQRNLVPSLSSVKTPVLLIHGRNDTMASLEYSLSLLPLLVNSELHVFNRCGHWVQYEQAGKFNRMVLDFLQHDD